MSKARKVFGSDDTFLSFPVSPLPFEPRELELELAPSGVSADEARARLRNLHAFSTLVNLIPDDEAWLPDESRFLWDVYGDVLRDANCARSDRTPQEESAYKKALAYLRDRAPSSGPGGQLGGEWTDSAAVLAYRRHKDAWWLAQQRYQAAKLTAETSSDADERARWTATEEPVLRAELDALQAAWQIAGNKSAVESAQSTLAQLGARSPLQTWAEWKSRFNVDIDGLTGASDTSTVYPSFFAPTNALDDAAWRPFRLSADEIAALLREAPAELQARLAGAAGATSDVTAVSFEFSSALIVRPWFVADALRARFWRFANGERVISNGAEPPSGACPAYVTALVFARKIVETRPPAAPADPQAGLRFLVAVRDARVRESIAQAARGESSAGELPAAQRVLLQRHLQQHVALQARARTQLAPAMRAERAMVAPQPRIAPLRMHVAPAVAPAHAPIAAATLTRSRMSAFTRASVIARPTVALPSAPPPATPAPAPPAPTVAPTAPDDSIYVLAFICKRVPLCPNPDAALTW